MSFDWSFDNLGLLNAKFRQMRLYVVRSQAHRLISTGFVRKDADGGNVIETQEQAGRVQRVAKRACHYAAL